MRRGLALLGVVAGIAVLLVTSAGPALAHEERTVGKYAMAVGFGAEPAYAGEKNSVQMFLRFAANDKPVVDLGPTLKVQVIFGSETSDTMTMEPNFEIGEFGIPGDYDAFFIPTRPGDYTFHLTGSIKGQKIDEKFTSSPSTFSPVDDPQKVEFPAQDPTTGQLNDRLDRELPRIDSALADQKSNLQASIDSARLLGIIGLVLGGLSLVVGGVALVRSRRRS
jgi:hypothetical protein